MGRFKIIIILFFKVKGGLITPCLFEGLISLENIISLKSKPHARYEH